MSETHLSAEAHERLTKELEELTTEGRVRIARTIEAARALGDLSENGDYHAAKEEQGRMEARIRQIQAMLKEAVIVEGVGGGGEVQPGAVVTLRYEGDDDTERFLVGSMEERRADIDIVSPGSPLGAALLGGKKKGDIVEYETPTGARIKVEIVDVGR